LILDLESCFTILKENLHDSKTTYQILIQLPVFLCTEQNLLNLTLAAMLLNFKFLRCQRIYGYI